MLGPDLAASLDPASFARKVGFDPHPWQVKALRSEARRQLWLCGRQVGKTATSALLALHTALYQPGSTVLIAAPAWRQSAEVFRRVTGMYRQLGKPVPADAENVTSLSLESGSRILSLPGGTGGDTLRGYSVDLAILDEASRIDDALVEAVMPMLGVSRGRLLALSTPAGRRGWFWEAWQRGGQEWERVRVLASDSPLWTAEALAEQRELLGEYSYRQEFELEFVDDEESVFQEAWVTAMFTDQFAPLFEEVRGA